MPKTTILQELRARKAAKALLKATALDPMLAPGKDGRPVFVPRTIRQDPTVRKGTLILTTEEADLLQQAIFTKRCQKKGEAELTDDNLFGDIAYQAGADSETLRRVQMKLHAAGLCTWKGEY